MALWVRISFLTLFIIHSLTVCAQLQGLKSGPMLGPITTRTALIWVQTNGSKSININYKPKGSSESYISTASTQTSAHQHYTATISVEGLIPDVLYEYQVVCDGVPLNSATPLEFKTHHLMSKTQPPQDFSFAIGSCFYINDDLLDITATPLGGEYHIIESIREKSPNFMLWLGDNTYYRQGDYDSRYGMYYRQTHTRNLPELQKFLSSQPHYAIWDDHDFGINDAHWNYPLKKDALEIFKAFWPSNSYGAGQTEGTTSYFRWQDCDFFLLDNRWYRTVNRSRGSILGEQQTKWLLESLLESKATYKFVAIGGQFLSNLKIFENHANYENERQEIIDFIDTHNITGVVFLSGDRHHSEISRMITQKGTIIYDITSSALTSKTYNNEKEANTLRVPGSMIGVRNFAVLEIKGSPKSRSLQVHYYDSENKHLFSHDLLFTKN